MPGNKNQHAPSYRHVAWCYDGLAWAYSLGAIDRAKRMHHAWIRPGDQVLYAGAGCGSEIAAACQLGAKVTCVEPCPAMASRLHHRLSSVADNFTIVPKAIQDVAAQPLFDLVVSHFFLNVFDAETMPAILGHLCDFVAVDGAICIADFKPNTPATPKIMRGFRSAYYRPLNLAGRLMGICAIHPIYDYEPMLREAGFTVYHRQSFALVRDNAGMYETLCAKKNTPT